MTYVKNYKFLCNILIIKHIVLLCIDNDFIKNNKN